MRSSELIVWGREGATRVGRLADRWRERTGGDAGALYRSGLGLLLDRRVAEAEPLLREAVRLSAERDGPAAHTTFVCRLDLGSAWSKLGRHEEAEALIRESLAYVEPAGPVEDEAMRARAYLAHALVVAGRPDAAEVETRPVTELPLGHPSPWWYAGTWQIRARALSALGRPAEAMDIAEKVIRYAIRRVQLRHWEWAARVLRAEQMGYLGRYADAVRECRTVLGSLEGADERRTVTVTVEAGHVMIPALLGLGRRDEAEAVARSTVDRAASHTATWRELPVSHANLAVCLGQDGRYDEALAQIGAARAVYERTGPADRDGSVALIANAAAGVLVGLAGFADAEVEADAALTVCARELGPFHHRTLEAGTLLGTALARRPAHRAEGRDRLRMAEAAWRTHFGPEHPRTVAVRATLAELPDDPA
ncbi:tetratricopeptide repeat protein (plasmid) [Embleya sp. NBC_00888]|uniref:tetratricopeptide repeat protein n=1 Tax=Embleya sp. NBC_00888 TaxID=2975960 RepID=UPI002F91B9D4|nr:tetratricopeptide repeat protein [Embleya sp. NBC_00888]